MKVYTLTRGEATIKFTTNGPNDLVTMVGVHSKKCIIPLKRKIGWIAEWALYPVNEMDSTNVQNTYTIDVDHARNIWESAVAVGFSAQA